MTFSKIKGIWYIRIKQKQAEIRNIDIKLHGGKIDNNEIINADDFLDKDADKKGGM